jgi:cystathionine beta-lyase/cystathionine gamma-synthase
LLSFEVKLTEEDARKRLPLFLKQLKLFAVAPSLGGAPSFVCCLEKRPNVLQAVRA